MLYVEFSWKVHVIALTTGENADVDYCEAGVLSEIGIKKPNH